MVTVQSYIGEWELELGSTIDFERLRDVIALA